MADQETPGTSKDTHAREAAGTVERTAAALRGWLDRIRRIPTVLAAVLWASVVAGVVIAFLWFIRADSAWVRWLAVPWLVLAAVPQIGQWILVSSVRELFALPERLLALRSSLSDESGRVLQTIRRDKIDGREPRGFLATLREAYSIHGEIAKVVATRTILHRFTGAIAVFIGPVSFVANCLIILLAVISLALAAP